VQLWEEYQEGPPGPGEANARFEQALLLVALKHHEHAAGAWRAFLFRFGDSDAPNIMRQGALARFNEGVAFHDTGRWAEAVTAYDEVEYLYGDHDNVGFAELAAKALLNKGLLL
jgi:hypothetical protein